MQRRKLVVRDWLAAANLPKTGADAGDDSAQPFVETTYVSDALDRLERVERAQLLGGAGSACGYRDDPVSDFAAAGAYTVRYAYDADSRLVEQVTPYEHTTLAYTPAGRLSQARSGPDDMTIREQEPTRFAYDALGYLESTQLDETVARWVRDAAGAVVEYTEQGTCGPERGVRVERNELGKITRVEDTIAGIACTYSYDAAGRLIRAVNSTGYAVDWVYDHAGLLLREESCEGENLVRLRVFTYADGGRVQSMRVYEKALAVQSEAVSAGVVDADSAGEAPEGMVRVAAIEYTYNERGFRTQATGCGGSVTRWDWDVLGSLERVHTYSGDHESSGVLTSDVQFVNSAERGMPVAVSGGSLGSGEAGNYSPMLWGPAAGNAPQLLGVGAVQTPASSTVIGGRDTPLGTENLGYGLQRASGPVSEPAGFGVDVWGIPAPISWGVSSDNQGFALGQAGLPVGVGLSAHGSLVTAGGELMGDRVYDPATAGFLAPDPLDSVMGSGWMGAPYVFAGGDPVNMFDPTGRRPLTIDEARQLHDAYYTPSLEEKLDSFGKDFNRFALSYGFTQIKFYEDFMRDPWGWITSHPSEMAVLGLGLVAAALIVVGVITFNPFIASMGAFMLVSMEWSYFSQIWHKGKADPNEIIQEGLFSALIDLVTLGVGKGLKFVLKPLLSRFGIRWGAHEVRVPGGMSSSGRARPGVVPGRSVVVKYPQLYRKGAVSSGGRSAEDALYEGRYGRQLFDASNLDFRGSGFAASGVVVPESGAHVPLRPSAGGRSAVEVPPVAVSGVDGSRVAPVQGSGASRGASQVPLKPVEAPLVGEVRPVSGVESGAAGVQAVKPGGVADDAVAARGSAGGVREPEVQLKPVEGPKVENLAPEGREAVRVLRDDRSLQPIHSEVDKPAQQIMYPDDLKSWVDTELPQASRIGSASEIDGTPVRYHNKFGKFHDAKRDYYQGLKNGGVEGPRPEFSPWKAEKTEADYNTAFEGLSEVEKKKHSIISLDNFKGVIPQEIKESVKSIWETGRLPEDKLWKKAQGPNEYENVPENKSGGHILPEKDVNGNPITYTEYDVKPPELTNKENGKLGLDRGKHRLVVGSNGSIYYSPDHYLTFIRLID